MKFLYYLTLKLTQIVWISLICIILLSLSTYSDILQASSRLTLEQLKNFDYYIHMYNQKIKLKNGIFESKSTENYLKVSFADVALGDLNNDAQEDAAIILVSSGGGSGLFYELAVVINNNGHPYHITSELLEDRVQINSIAIISNAIIIDMVTHGPNDPQCCPTVKKIVKYRLYRNTLIKK